jgi:hypothetical protein
MDSSGKNAGCLLKLIKVAPRRHQIAPTHRVFRFSIFHLSTMVRQRRGKKQKSPSVEAIH